jgi:hypothetical protein
MAAVLTVSAICESTAEESWRVWQKVEVVLKADKDYADPYQDVDVWVDLEGPDFRRRCFGFWDGDDIFRVRITATAPGKWRWRSGSNQNDSGLNGRSGSFTALAWTKAELEENPSRRGMILASANGHAFEYADGTPYFLLGDTWWATSTFRYPWFDDDRPRPMGPTAGFKDYVRFRREQGYNCIAMIAAFPFWTNDGRPNGINMTDGTVLRAAWRQAGTKSAKAMHNEDGERPFLMPGKIPGYEDVFPNLERINPKYFQSMDRKIDYLNAQGIVPFIEVTRRDVGQAWKKYYNWPDSYSRYIQYVWSRYQANICLFSPIHFDTPAKSIPASEWNGAANRVIDRYGSPPFGTMCGTNANPSSLENYGHVEKARWLTFHQIGNRRTHDVYDHLTKIYHTSPPVPGINGEPYYDGMLDAEPGSKGAALYCRSAMYGSVLSGGFGGHIYGAGGWKGGMWSGEVEKESLYPIWEVVRWPSADQMRHLATFVLTEDRRYQELIPSMDSIHPNRTGKPDSCTGWAYCAKTADHGFFLIYFERDCPRAVLSGTSPGRRYRAQWFDPRSGKWIPAGVLAADGEGRVRLPAFPDAKENAADDWALKLRFHER